jgi:hypothetical protein
MLPLIFLLLTILALTGIGLFLVIGTFKRLDFLVQAPQGWFYFYPYWFLRKLFGEHSIYYFHIFVGIVFILSAIGILLNVLSYLVSRI